MKNVLKSLALVAVSALAVVSCQKNEVVGNGNEGDIFFTLNTGDTRTYMVADGNSYQPMWAKGDEIGVLFEKFAKDRTLPQGKLTNSNENGQTASFEGTIAAEKEGTLYAFYPAKFAKTYDNSTVGFDILANQKPTATSFDPAADLLISKPVSYNAVGGSVSIDDVFFARALSILKINVYSSDFEAIQGQFLGKLTVTASDTLLSGRPVFDLTKGDAMITKYNTQNKSVGALYDEDVVSVGSSKTATGCSVFLMVAPGTHKGDATLNFEGETGGYTFSKEVTLPKDMVLNPGKLTEINLSLAESNCEVKVAETRIWVDNFEKCTENKTKYEVSQTGAKGTGLNENTTYVYGENSNTNIRFNNNGHSQSDPYLYVSGNDTFTVNNLSVSDETSLKLSAQTKNAANITLKCKESSAETWTEIGSWTSTGSFSEQQAIFDISKTATSIDLSFASDAAVIIDDIVLESFVDQRTALATPSGVAAAVDATTSNKVNVSWSAVENAGSYEVTLSTAGEEDVVENAETNSISFTGLKYSTQYSVKVKAISSDVSLYKDSEYSAAANVTTGAKPEGTVYYEKVTSAPDDWCGDYLIVYEAGNVAFDGSLETLDVASNTKAVTIEDGKILATAEMTAIQFTVAYKSGSSTVYSLKSASGKYISGTTTNAAASNGMKQADSDANYEISFNELTIESKSSDQQMALKYNKTSGQTRFRFYKSGQEDVALYKLADPRTAQSLSFSAATGTIDLNGNVKNLPTLDASGAHTAISWSSSDESVATVSGTGEVTALAKGTTTITATAAADATYKSATASYELTVSDSTPGAALTTMDAIFAAATTAGSTATEARVQFNNWVVSGVKNSSNAYLTDNNGKGLIIYTSGHGFAVGNILSGTVDCKVQLYNGSAELTSLTSGTTGLTVTTGGTITPVKIAIADLSGVNTGAVITFESLKYDGSVFSDGVNTITPYNTLSALPTLSAGRSYKVTGMYLQFKDTKEIAPRTEDDIVLLDGPYLNASASKTSVAAAGETVTITVNTNIEGWTVTSDNAAFVVGAKSGNTVPVVVSENTSTTDSRTAHITVSATGVDSKVITLTQAKAGGSGTPTYTKVTSAPADWSGTYIMVYDGKVCTAGVDAASNYVEATDDGGVITGDFSDCEVEIATYSTGYSIKALGGNNSGKFLEGKGSSSNGTTFAASASKVTTFSISDGVVTITNNSNVFAYNSMANNLRWRFFKSTTASSSGYYKPSLYKKN